MLFVFANILTMSYEKFAGLTVFSTVVPIFCSLWHIHGLHAHQIHRSIHGIWSADLWNSKHVLHVHKVTVAVDLSG